jgi:ribosome-binding protein aMBF1 (putative translation factor)
VSQRPSGIRTTGRDISQRAGRTIRSRRDELDWSREDLSANIASAGRACDPPWRISAKVIELIEDGRIRPDGSRQVRLVTVDEASILARVLGMSIATLLGEEG